MNHERISSTEQPELPIQFQSILFLSPPDGSAIHRDAPECFRDLNLDQIVSGITAGREEYDLIPLFHTSLNHIEDVYYRYDVFKDLEDALLLGHMRTFAQGIKRVRANLEERKKHYYERQKQAALIDAVECYCITIVRLAESLATMQLQSRGFVAFRVFLNEYVNSAEFESIVSDTQRAKSDLASVKYRLHVKGKRVAVTKSKDETDYGEEVSAAFQKFKEREAKEYRFEHRFLLEMNHVEAGILDLVVELYPEVFTFLDEYANRYENFTNPLIERFDRELQFYIACLEYIEPIKQAGLPFCSPVLSDRSKYVEGIETFDLALAALLVRERKQIVTNDFYLKDRERVFVVTGPNQGGKTTFARMFGQLHYLGSIGFPIPARNARLFLFDKLFTHFEREEDLQNLSGKLEDELLRIRTILTAATANSILIMNESFLSTTLSDAIFLSKKVMRKIVELDLLCVSVTFLDELATFSDSTVSMVSTVNPNALSERTFKVIRKPADGLAYAGALAEKYRLTYESVRSRVTSNGRKRLAS